MAAKKPAKGKTNKKDDAKKTCFVIMPITTPPDVADKLEGGKEHFTDVYDVLFKPAIELAGMEAIPPNAKGAEVIQAEIIKNLEEADLVLCDISCLNPNVFFELGVRTALNKSVALVRDEHVERPPFDTGIVNHYAYRSDLKGKFIDLQREELREHLLTSLKGQEDGNSLWRYFGVSSTAVPPTPLEAGDKLDFLFTEVQQMKKAVNRLAGASTSRRPATTVEEPAFQKVVDVNARLRSIRQLASDAYHMKSSAGLSPRGRETLNRAAADLGSIGRNFPTMKAEPSYIEAKENLEQTLITTIDDN